MYKKNNAKQAQHDKVILYHKYHANYSVRILKQNSEILNTIYFSRQAEEK